MFFQKLIRSKCDYAFYNEEPFPLNNQDDSSENLVVAEARVGIPERYTKTQGDNAARSFDPYSMQLILGALYENFLIRPLRALTNFVIVTKSIFLVPSARVEEKYLVS